MHTKLRLVACALAVVLGGCGSGGGAGASGTGAAASPSRSANLITADELTNESGSNAYDAIDHLRPAMLTMRPSSAGGSGGGGGGGRSRSGGGGGGSATGPNVYLDTKRLGDTSALKNISVNTIREIHYYNASDAEQRFGPDNPAGVIQLVSR
jgi:hypothetical protein